MARPRDYAAEYQRRIASGQARGLTRQQARGRHPAEGRRLPDGTRALPLSASELKQKRLLVSTLEMMHRVNVGLRGANASAWRRAVEAMGWEVSTSKRGLLFTQDRVPSEILDLMRAVGGGEARRVDYFFGY